MGNKKIELADFKEQANTYYKNLTKNAPHKGIGSHEYIYFSYGIEWAFNHLPQSNYDKLKEDNKMLLEALKMVVNMDSWIRYFGNGSIDKKLKEAIIKAEPK